MKIAESIAGSRYKKTLAGNYPDGVGFKHPWAGVTKPKPFNEYSWLKSPRYDTGAGYKVFEVGPLSRLVVAGAYFAGVLAAVGYGATPVWGQPGPDISSPVHPLHAVYNVAPATGGPNLSGVLYTGDSTLDRIAARTVETRIMLDVCQQELNNLQGTVQSGYASTGATDPQVPVSTTVKKGYGMTEASRGALSHWMKMKNGKIKTYQCVVPTTWNASPRDVNGNPGPAEKSMEGDMTWIANPAEPIELPRVTHSYDFCIACAVHLITPKGDVTKVMVPALP
jgi:Ni,Fe-hydrogenase I large subunit